jgi:MFS family permease
LTERDVHTIGGQVEQESGGQASGDIIELRHPHRGYLGGRGMWESMSPLTRGLIEADHDCPPRTSRTADLIIGSAQQLHCRFNRFVFDIPGALAYP